MTQPTLPERYPKASRPDRRQGAAAETSRPFAFFFFFKHIKYFTYVFTANKCKLVPSNMLRFDIKKWC